MTEIDFKKQSGGMYSPPDSGIVSVNVPPMRFLMADGSRSNRPGGPCEQNQTARPSVPLGRGAGHS